MAPNARKSITSRTGSRTSMCIDSYLRRWDNDGLIQTIRTPGRQRRIPLAEVKRILGENVAAVEGDFPADRETMQSFLGKDKTPKKLKPSENMSMLASLFKNDASDEE